MSLDPFRLQQDFPYLIPRPEARPHGATVYRLRLPILPRDREFAWAELLLPKGFPEYASAKIMLSPDAVLRIPHVEGNGALCIEGDPGPGQGYSTEDRVLLLLLAYQEQFLEPWITGKLDSDFSKEPLNYWLLEVCRLRSSRDPVQSVLTVDECPAHAMVREGVLLLPSRIVIAAGDDLPITNRVIRSLGAKATQRIRVLVADIPISHVFTPSTWPRGASDLGRLLRGRLRSPQREQFQTPLRKRHRARGVHRIALLRNPNCGFAYLLPDGPPTVVSEGIRKKAYPSLRTPLPLRVARLDPSWTVGRDQRPEVAHRQTQHVLVLGAGALGAPVVDQLAKAGVGRITLVDMDYLAPANLGRHLLGAESIDQAKATAVAQRINLGQPATVVTPQVISAEQWLKGNSLSNVNLVMDLTGDPNVRWHVDQARQRDPCPFLVGWMEPYVAAAHVCLLPSGIPWMQGTMDPMDGLQAVTWPDEVIRQEPGCSSRFQSYTASAATYAIALVAENALEMIDGSNRGSKIISWVRGQHFLDRHFPGLELRQWAQPATSHNGLVIERPYP
jgi:molybdopterin/thiamine biosynthesis adenylyltransferase